MSRRLFVMTAEMAADFLWASNVITHEEVIFSASAPWETSYADGARPYERVCPDCLMPLYDNDQRCRHRRAVLCATAPSYHDCAWCGYDLNHGTCARCGTRGPVAQHRHIEGDYDVYCDDCRCTCGDDLLAEESDCD